MTDGSESASTGAQPPPIFIMGCQRSGTTLLTRLLDSHPRIAIFPGCHYYVLFGPHRHFYGDLKKSSNLIHLIKDLRTATRMQGVKPPSVDEFLDALVSPTFAGVLATSLRLFAQQQGKVRSGDKTPEHYFHLAEIMEDFPKSPVVFIIRDPRDAILSIQKGMGTSLDGSVYAWNQAFLSYQRASRPVHLVRYESLVREPAETLAAVCASFGETYEPEMLNFFEQTPDRYHSMPHHRKLFQKIDSQSIGRFQEMPQDMIARIEAGCASGMEAMGYPLVTSPSKHSSVAMPKKRNAFRFVLDRLGYYGMNRARWQRGLTHWKMVAHVRVRYAMCHSVK